METVRAALNPPVDASHGLVTGHVLALHHLLMAKKGPPGILPANKVLNTMHALGSMLTRIDHTLERADGGAERVGKLAIKLCHSGTAAFKKVSDKPFKARFEPLLLLSPSPSLSLSLLPPPPPPPPPPPSLPLLQPPPVR